MANWFFNPFTESFASQRAAPRKIKSPHNVTTKAWTLSFVTSKPLTRPIATPKASVAAMAAKGCQ
ncbi:MAG TPA: hypothetical protein VND64_34760 [Pirellulales bacterium]|nr:hypothetical protein [Pirellulales bacterium]